MTKGQKTGEFITENIFIGKTGEVKASAKAFVDLALTNKGRKVLKDLDSLAVKSPKTLSTLTGTERILNVYNNATKMDKEFATIADSPCGEYVVITFIEKSEPVMIYWITLADFTWAFNESLVIEE